MNKRGGVVVGIVVIAFIVLARIVLVFIVIACIVVIVVINNIVIVANMRRLGIVGPIFIAEAVVHDRWNPIGARRRRRSTGGFQGRSGFGRKEIAPPALTGFDRGKIGHSHAQLLDNQIALLHGAHRNRVGLFDFVNVLATVLNVVKDGFSENALGALVDSAQVIGPFGRNGIAIEPRHVDGLVHAARGVAADAKAHAFVLFEVGVAHGTVQHLLGERNGTVYGRSVREQIHVAAAVRHDKAKALFAQVKLDRSRKSGTVIIVIVVTGRRKGRPM